MKKAAVVIGVNRTGELAPLQSAAAGATSVAAWLKKEGFDVACLTDAKKPVTSSAVTEAIERFVTLPATYSLLVVYFSGHGYWFAQNDYWLLSGAPQRTSEAVNLRGALDLAQCCGIPNVVFVSDACRSIPVANTGASLLGVNGFPVFNGARTTSKVDYFKATSEARPAYEGQVDGSAQSLLTAALLSAYRMPDASMVRKVEVDGKPLEVVPNRQLEDYLQRKVDELLARIDRRLRQDLVISVPSSEATFIARVAKQPARGKPVVAPLPPPAGAEPPVAEDRPRDDARTALAAVQSTLRQRALVGGRKPALFEDQGASVEARLLRRTPDAQRTHFESETGFVVQGAVVAQAVLRGPAPGAPVCTESLLTPGDGQGDAGLVRIEGPDSAMRVPRKWAGSLALRFADGRSTVLAVFAGYIGHVTVKPRGVAGVNYVPSANSERWPDYKLRREELDRLRAMAALATEHEVFQLNSVRDAQELAARIRQGKALDPTLGLYAAQAFAQAGNDEELADVLKHMREDLGADLFDVHLLASRLPSAEPAGTWPVAPLCPMLSQSWTLLGTRGVMLPEPLRLAGAHLCDALWTTFAPEAGDAFMAWMAQGDDR